MLVVGSIHVLVLERDRKRANGKLPNVLRANEREGKNERAGRHAEPNRLRCTDGTNANFYWLTLCWGMCAVGILKPNLS